MVSSSQLAAGTIVKISNKMYRVESCVKVTVAKGTPFIKTKLRELSTNKLIEKNFKQNQDVEEVSLLEKPVEFLYIEGKDYLFLNTKTLEQVLIPAAVVGPAINYLKEGLELLACFYGDKVFSVELPQFLELMIAKIDEDEEEIAVVAEGAREAVLETGAKVEVPPFIEVGDIIKVNTKTGEYIQRV